jgi:hypothetical protein
LSSRQSKKALLLGMAWQLTEKATVFWHRVRKDRRSDGASTPRVAAHARAPRAAFCSCTGTFLNHFFSFSVFFFSLSLSRSLARSLYSLS